MKHTQLVILALNLAVLPLSPVTPLDAAERVKPNVLFIMADDLRAELASYGSPAVTPNLVRLARKCVQFDRAYCQQAVCNPSRSSLLTGRRPDTLQVWNNSTHFREPNPDMTTIPLWFKEHGYTTRCVGKIFHNWHTKVQDRPFFLAVGFWRPHAQFNAPKRFWDLYDRAKLPRLDPRRPVGAPEIAFHQSTEILGPVANQKKPTPQ